VIIEAPSAGYSELLAAVRTVRYKPRWEFSLHYGPATSASGDALAAAMSPVSVTTGGSVILHASYTPVYLMIVVRTVNSQPPHGPVTIRHMFRAYDQAWTGSWLRFLLDCVLAVERHEAMEYFEVGGRKPFFPEHGPGAEPYAIKERPA
jgi:hypothetical protein